MNVVGRPPALAAILGSPTAGSPVPISQRSSPSIARYVLNRYSGPKRSRAAELTVTLRLLAGIIARSALDAYSSLPLLRSSTRAPTTAPLASMRCKTSSRRTASSPPLVFTLEAQPLKISRIESQIAEWGLLDRRCGKRPPASRLFVFIRGSLVHQ